MYNSYVAAAILASVEATKLNEDYPLLNLESHSVTTDVNDFFDNGYEPYVSSHSYNSRYYEPTYKKKAREREPIFITRGYATDYDYSHMSDSHSSYSHITDSYGHSSSDYYYESSSYHSYHQPYVPNDVTHAVTQVLHGYSDNDSYEPSGFAHYDDSADALFLEIVKGHHEDKIGHSTDYSVSHYYSDPSYDFHNRTYSEDDPHTGDDMYHSHYSSHDYYHSSDHYGY